MYVSVLDGLDAGNEFHAACCAQKMAHHGFCGVYLYFSGMVSQCQLDSLCLKQVIVMSAGSMGIDIVNIFRLNACVLNGILHGAGRTASVLCRGGDVVCVTGCTVTHYLGQDIGPPGLCVV